MKKWIFLISLIGVQSLFAGIDLSDPRVALTEKIFNELRHDNTEILDNFYHQDIEFQDPVGKVQGLSVMKKYYQEMYQSVESIRFVFQRYSVTDNRYYFSWDMYLKTPKLNSGEEFVVGGVSEILFKDGLVIYHRDYFDMGEFIYERIPVLGRIIKSIRERFEHHP